MMSTWSEVSIRRMLGVLVGLAMIAALPRAAWAIPPWARKYSVNCSHCHYPAVPRLNATGIAFKWAGYRMPEEIGEKTDVEKIEEYLGTRMRIQYNYAKTRGEPTSESGISVPAASVFAAGPFGKNFGAYAELEREAEGSVDLVAEATGTWGRETSYGGLRLGTGHLLYGGAIAGLDRPTGIAAPLPMSQPTTAAVPFSFAGDHSAVEAFYVFGGRNRLSLRALTSLRAAAPLGTEPEEGGEEEEAEPAAGTKQDFAIANQFMWDAAGSGLTTVAYFGQVAGLDPLALDRSSRYVRVAATANKIVRNFELLGGYVYSRDRNLPVRVIDGLSVETQRATGSAYWASGQYFLPKTPLALYTRYEFLDPDTDAAADAQRRWVVGGVMPINVPEYLRLGLEYIVDRPQADTSPRAQRLAVEVLVAF